MTWILFPGRHHLLTRFQADYLRSACEGRATDIKGKRFASNVRGVLWAVTSANHENTRRNPLPAHRRETAIERFATELPIESFVYLIDDLGATERFAEYVLKKVEVDSQGRFRLTPSNTVVACSTPEVLAQYEALGFRILPVELEDRRRGRLKTETPWQVLQELARDAEAGADWRTSRVFEAKAAPASRAIYLRYGYGDRVIELHRRPVLTEDGDLTATRDYNTYARSFDDGADRKYELVKDWVVPGRIVDIGCCAGALVRRLSFDDRLRESDLYGIELARPLYAECLHRKERGDFGQDNVFFYNADAVSGALFRHASVNTFLTFALTHELESYQGRPVLKRFMRVLHRQLSSRGRWINVDVVGPENKEREVVIRLNTEDGRIDDWGAAVKDRKRFKAHLDGLSTYARFLRFARDFRNKEGYRLRFSPVKDRRGAVRLSLRDACEFLSKKDYTDNWESEMHETFCFWSFSEWKREVESAGLRIHPASRAYSNPWIVKNRFKGKVELFERDAATPMAYPVTNMLLVAQTA